METGIFFSNQLIENKNYVPNININTLLISVNLYYTYFKFDGHLNNFNTNQTMKNIPLRQIGKQSIQYIHEAYLQGDCLISDK